jgi:hypothetical protein
MNLAYLSTISALAGTIIGGVTTFATSWLTHTAQLKSARLAAERARREAKDRGPKSERHYRFCP